MQTAFEIELPEPFPAQEAILASATRYNVVAGGHEAGKTAMAIETLLMSPYGALNGFPVAFLLPDQDAVLAAKRRVFSCIEPLLMGRLDRSRIDLANGGSIYFFALDADRLELWDQVALIVVDDAARVPNMHDVFFDVLEPLLSRYRGHAWFFSKPLGMFNGFAKLAAMVDADPRWSLFSISAESNPFISQADVEADRAKMPEATFAQERRGEFVTDVVELSAGQSILGRDETFRQWCERLAADGLKVDGRPFELEKRPAMHFIYDMIPSTVEEAFDRVDVIMKCTQVGFTVMEMLAMLYLALRFSASKIGMFMPSQMLATGKSSKRFMPIVRTVPPVYSLMTEEHASGTKGGEGNVLTRNLGESIFYFLWTSGKTATESNPMDVISFDEVQEMKIADMEKTRERMSASSVRYTLMGSTANNPDEDIHWWFKQGTQHQFHTLCTSCGTHQVLDDHFPSCIGFDPTAPRRNKRERNAGMVGEYRYRCHACSGWIDDPQLGEWRARVPDAIIRSVHFPQFLSPTISPRDIALAYASAKDMKNFYNRKLGKPYVDPTQVPVNLEMLAACAAEGLRLHVQWKERAVNTYMGIDQMGAFNVVLICERLPSGHMALIHAEEIYSDDPFGRCDVLIEQYGTRVCVVETLPNYNDAKRFANRHPGIVFLAGYSDMKDDMLRWGDSVPSKLERKTDAEDRDRFTVTLDQYKCMQVAFARLAKKVCVFPDPSGLVQELSENGDNGKKGERRLMPILQDRVFFHFTRTALIAERDEEQNKYRRRVVKVGIDPHFSYAFMLMNVAWARAHGTDSFIMPDADAKEAVVETAGAVAKNTVLNKFLEQRAAIGEERCGGCAAFDPVRGYCSEQEVLVRPADPGCYLFIQA